MGAVELSRLLLQRRADFLIRPHIFARWRRDLDVEQPVDHVVLRRKEPLHRVAPLGQSLAVVEPVDADHDRSEEHTSELQPLMRNSYAVFCSIKKTSHVLRLFRIPTSIYS